MFGKRYLLVLVREVVQQGTRDVLENWDGTEEVLFLRAEITLAAVSVSWCCKC